MIIIQKNKGYIIGIIIFLNLLFSELISETIMNDENYFQNNLYPLSLGFLSAALMLYLLHQFFHSKQEVIRNNRTGKETIPEEKMPSFFFIKIKQWSWICFGIAFICYFKQTIMK